VGLYDLNREIRAVGRCYRQIIADWSQVLPTQSVCLTLPIVPASEYEDRAARRHRAQARELRLAERAEKARP
jgi:hypothetical protein